jgi:hypothetical protein
MGILLEDQYTFIIISHSVLLRMRNVSDKKLQKKSNTHFIFRFFFFENRSVYEIMWKAIVETDRAQLTLWLTSIIYWVPKATNTLSEYVKTYCFSTATVVPRKRLMLRYTYIACPVYLWPVSSAESSVSLLHCCHPRELCSEWSVWTWETVR